MAAPPKHKEELLPSPPPQLFNAAVSKVAVTQICLSVGYHAAEPAALRSLSDVAVRYLVALARSAASIANARGRTDTNILDLVRAMEGLGLSRGFAGASDATRPLLGPGVLTELMAFVGSVEEVPFPKPIRRRRPSEEGRSSPSFAQMGLESPFPHVPRWLPCFPESWCAKGNDGLIEDGMRTVAVAGRNGIKEGEAQPAADMNLPAGRKRVRFKLGLENGVIRELAAE